MDQSDERSKSRQRSPYLPPPPPPAEDVPEVRVPRASPLPSSLTEPARRPRAVNAPRAPERSNPREEVGPLGRAVLALIVFVLLAVVAYLAFASQA